MEDSCGRGRPLWVETGQSLGGGHALRVQTQPGGLLAGPLEREGQASREATGS